MKNSLCILMRHAPYGQIHDAEALRHMGGALAEKMDTCAVLMDDGVYAACDGHDTTATPWTALSPLWAQHLAKGARLYVHAPSAQARGLLAAERLVAGAQWIEDDALARLLVDCETVMVY
ncbi:MAG: DsrE family protein [Chloroflexi bacterium]|nr:DsrE family protein [Chloroflexota bacterium]MBI3733969.1 DsrE family protein [Chloroflexota bacterium]